METRLQIFSLETEDKPCNEFQLLLKYCNNNPIKKSKKNLTFKKQLVMVLFPFL